MEEGRPRRRGRILSFKYAFQGLYDSVKQEPNLKIHLTIALLVVLAGLYFQITTQEWVDVILLIGLVVSLELTNTAVESAVNGLTDQLHPAAKLAKDISAAAVLVAAITSVVVGLIIFLPYLLLMVYSGLTFGPSK